MTAVAPTAAAPRARRPGKKRLRRAGWNLVGLAVFTVLIFPVFWMISTAFKPTTQINRLTPTWFPFHPTVRHFTDAVHRCTISGPT